MEKYMKKLFLLLAASFLSFNCFGANSSSNNQQMPNIAQSLAELYQNKLTTKPILSRKELTQLKEILNAQDKIVPIAISWANNRQEENKYAEAYHNNLEQNGTQIAELPMISGLHAEASSPYLSKRFQLQGGDKIFIRKTNSTEALAFSLRYNNILHKRIDDYSVDFHDNVSAVWNKWKNSPNKEIQNIMQMLAIKVNYMQACFQRDQIEENLITMLKDIKRRPREKDVKKLYDLLPDAKNAASLKNPLLFFNVIDTSICGYLEQCNDNKRNEAFTSTVVPNFKKIQWLYSKQKQQLSALIDDITKKTISPAKKKTSSSDPLAYNMQFANNSNRRNNNKKRNKRNKKRAAVKKTPIKKTEGKTAPQPAFKPKATKPVQPAKSSFSSSHASSSSSSQAQKKQAINTQSTPMIQHHNNILSDTDIMVEIHDPKHLATLKLFKVDNPTATKPLYTTWVKSWFNDSKKALDKQGYNDPNNKRFKYRKNAPLIHAFSQLVDTYIPTCGTECKYFNKKTKQSDIAVTIPGSITQNNQETLGLFTYLINSKTQQCYHRNFEKRSRGQLLADYLQKGYYEVEFPSLEA